MQFGYVCNNAAPYEHRLRVVSTDPKVMPRCHLSRTLGRHPVTEIVHDAVAHIVTIFVLVNVTRVGKTETYRWVS